MHTDAQTACSILALAMLWDACCGEYPSRLHPVVWMGNAISTCLRLAPTSGWYRQFFFGACLTLLIVGLSGGGAWFVLQVAANSHLLPGESIVSHLLEILTGTFLLKASFALRELGRAAMRVVYPLECGNLASARLALRSLCSRDPSELTQEELLAAAIESLAENTSDSVVAPLFYYVLLGVPGAVAYRAINTLDAMIGYRGKYEALGKFAARLDDVANLIPARLTALLFLVTGWLFGGSILHGCRILWRDSAKTPSPNGGWPMALMAGLLQVQLDKKGIYSLGDANEPLTARKVRQAWKIVIAACVGMASLCGLALVCLV